MQEYMGFKVVIREDWPAGQMALVNEPQNPIDAAAMVIGATHADVPGLWNAPGYPELTTGQLLSAAAQKHADLLATIRSPKI